MTTAPGLAFGQRLRELRDECGVSQDDLARQSGINRVAIGKLEKGAQEPLLKTILRLARGLDVEPGLLLNDLVSHGERRLTPEEFQQHCGQLPTDSEG